MWEAPSPRKSKVGWVRLHRAHHAWGRYPCFRIGGHDKAVPTLRDHRTGTAPGLCSKTISRKMWGVPSPRQPKVGWVRLHRAHHAWGRYLDSGLVGTIRPYPRDYRTGTAPGSCSRTITRWMWEAPSPRKSKVGWARLHHAHHAWGRYPCFRIGGHDKAVPTLRDYRASEVMSGCSIDRRLTPAGSDNLSSWSAGQKVGG